MSFEVENALQWFTRMEDPRLCITTGHAGLDRMLGNSFPLKTVTEIYGETGIGKIELLLTVVARLLTCSEKLSWVVIILDYNGSFRTDRLLKLIRLLAQQPDDEVGLHLLKRVVFERVYTNEDFKSSFHRLMSQFTSNHLIPLVIVNGVGAMLSDTSFMEQEGAFEQDQILRQMREFCSTSGGTIITSNHVVHWRGFPAPALGNTWINGITTRLLLNHDDISGQLSITLQRKVTNNDDCDTVFYKLRDDMFVEITTELEMEMTTSVKLKLGTQGNDTKNEKIN